jgi:hypothetical protein
VGGSWFRGAATFTKANSRLKLSVALLSQSVRSVNCTAWRLEEHAKGFVRHPPSMRPNSVQHPGVRLVVSAPRDVWHVTFLEPGLERPLPKTLTFKDEGKIRELARRGEAWQTSEDRQLLDYAIAKGEGGVYLRLSPEQYARLKRP